MNREKGNDIQKQYQNNSYLLYYFVEDHKTIVLYKCRDTYHLMVE
jgi:hypothetical protein